MTLLEVLRCTVHPDVSLEARLGPRDWHHQRAVLALEFRSGSLLGHRLLLEPRLDPGQQPRSDKAPLSPPPLLALPAPE